MLFDSIIYEKLFRRAIQVARNFIIFFCVSAGMHYITTIGMKDMLLTNLIIYVLFHMWLGTSEHQDGYENYLTHNNKTETDDKGSREKKAQE